MCITLEYSTTVLVPVDKSQPLPAKKELMQALDKSLCVVAVKAPDITEYFGCSNLVKRTLKREDASLVEVKIYAHAILPDKLDDQELEEFEICITPRDREEQEARQINEVVEPLAKFFCSSIGRVFNSIKNIEVKVQRIDDFNKDCLDTLSKTPFVACRKAALMKQKKILRKGESVLTFSFSKKEELDADHVVRKLFQMPGLEDAKNILKQIIASSAIEKQQRERGMQVSSHCWHMVFMGEPGTAKTTFAKGVARVLSEAKIVPTDKFVIYSRADLVGRYIGESEERTKEALEKGKGGVIFIDEAYALVGEGNDYGRIVIDQLIAFMEEHRDDTVFIFAGYPDKMQDFLNMNEGLRSRIMFHVPFKSYSNDEMWEIMNILAKEANVVVKETAKPQVDAYFDHMRQKPGFGNGRTARNYLEQSINQQRVRLFEAGNLEKLSDADLVTLLPQDFVVPVDAQVKPKHKIGFDAVG